MGNALGDGWDSLRLEASDAVPDLGVESLEVDELLLLLPLDDEPLLDVE